MRRAKLVGIAMAAAAMIGGPLGAAPAQAGCVHPACDIVRETVAFALQEVDDTRLYVDSQFFHVGEIAIETVCTIFPTQPQC